MNVFFSGPSSILATALIESYFREGHTLFICDAGAETAEEVTVSLEEKIGGARIDLAFLLGSENLFAASLSRPALHRLKRRQLLHNQAVCSYFARQEQPPGTVLSASSVLVYRHRSEEKIFEHSELAQGFPAEFFLALEEATEPLSARGIRVINLRLGRLVARTAPPSCPRLPRLPQYCPALLRRKDVPISWVSREDALRAIAYLLASPTISGTINVTSGDIVTLRDFYAPLKKAAAAPRLLRLPKFLVRLLCGPEGALFLEAGARAIPFRLMDSGFFFEDISLQEYLGLNVSAS